MSEKEILSRLERLEQQYKQLQETVKQLQRQLGRQAVDVADYEDDSERPWVEG